MGKWVYAQDDEWPSGVEESMANLAAGALEAHAGSLTMNGFSTSDVLLFCHSLVFVGDYVVAVRVDQKGNALWAYQKRRKPRREEDT